MLLKKRALLLLASSNPPHLVDLRGESAPYEKRDVQGDEHQQELGVAAPTLIEPQNQVGRSWDGGHQKEL
jgi:hypothetical protein